MPYATCLMSHVRRVRHAAAGMRTVPFELAVRNAGMNAGFVHTQTCSRVFFAFMVGYHGHGTPALSGAASASRVGVRLRYTVWAGHQKREKQPLPIMVPMRTAENRSIPSHVRTTRTLHGDTRTGREARNDDHPEGSKPTTRSSSNAAADQIPPRRSALAVKHRGNTGWQEVQPLSPRMHVASIQ